MYVLEWSKNTTRDSGDIENISELPELAELWKKVKMSFLSIFRRKVDFRNIGKYSVLDEKSNTTRKSEI
jgi:hypothetical protein